MFQRSSSLSAVRLPPLYVIAFEQSRKSRFHAIRSLAIRSISAADRVTPFGLMRPLRCFLCLLVGQDLNNRVSLAVDRVYIVLLVLFVAFLTCDQPNLVAVF